MVASALSAILPVIVYSFIEILFLDESGIPSGVQWLPYTVGIIVAPAIASVVSLGLVLRRSRSVTSSQNPP
jgi:hypothetical protein